MVPSQEKACVELERIQRITIKMVPVLKYIIYGKRFKEMQPNTLEERRYREDLIAIY